MANRKSQPFCRQAPIKVAAGYSRLNDRNAPLTIKRNVFETPKIDQQTLVAEWQANPTMTAAADRNLNPIRSRKPDGLNYRILIRSLNDNAGTTSRYELIPHH
jgi:hypothetical protein